jgi:plastocyanin
MAGNNPTFFFPNPVTINAGCSVTWRNASSGAPHTTTSLTGLWDSGNIAANQTFTRQFNSTGTFQYRCTIHPSNIGTVTVN